MLLEKLALGHMENKDESERSRPDPAQIPGLRKRSPLGDVPQLLGSCPKAGDTTAVARVTDSSLSAQGLEGSWAPVLACPTPQASEGRNGWKAGGSSLGLGLL